LRWSLKKALNHIIQRFKSSVMFSYEIHEGKLVSFHIWTESPFRVWNVVRSAAKKSKCHLNFQFISFFVVYEIHNGEFLTQLVLFSSVSDSRMFLTLCFSFKRATSSARDGIIVEWQTNIKWGILLLCIKNILRIYQVRLRGT